MAKTVDVRPKITLACTQCKERNYITKKNRRNDPDRLELKKFCPRCKTHTPHRETALTKHPEPPLIGLAHGSRHPGGRLGIERLMGAVADQARITTVPAYLDLAEPDPERGCTAARRRRPRNGRRRAPAFHSGVSRHRRCPETVRDVSGSSPSTWSLATSWVLATRSQTSFARAWSQPASTIRAQSAVRRRVLQSGGERGCF